MGHAPNLKNPHNPPGGPNRGGMLRRRADRHRLVLGMREEVETPANGANQPHQHSSDGEHEMRDEGEEE